MEELPDWPCSSFKPQWQSNVLNWSPYLQAHTILSVFGYSILGPYTREAGYTKTGAWCEPTGKAGEVTPLKSGPKYYSRLAKLGNPIFPSDLPYSRARM